MEYEILFLYAQGMFTREIVRTFKEMYGADASPSLISKVTDVVIEQVVEWQSRPLDAVYPIVYLDCIVVNNRKSKQREWTKDLGLANACSRASAGASASGGSRGTVCSEGCYRVVKTVNVPDGRLVRCRYAAKRPRHQLHW